MRKNIIFDFADEIPSTNNKGIKVVEERKLGIKLKKVQVLEDLNQYNKKGNYLSFEISSLDEKIISNNKIKYICKQIKDMISNLNLKENPHVLMVGLGNDDFSSDALGPETIKKINANSYLNDVQNRVSCIIPGVMKTTGLESASIIKSLVKQFKFDLVIVFDSLATRSVDRLFKVIQITDTEIIPGSGIKNFRKSLNAKYLGVPLIAVGVSMAIMYSSIIEIVLDHIHIQSDLEKEHKSFLIEQLKNNLVLTSKDTEFRVKNISINLSNIFNHLFN